MPGFIGGWVDALMMRIVDTLLSIPSLFLLIVLAVVFHPSAPLLILVIAFVSWLVPARLVRGETLTLACGSTCRRCGSWVGADDELCCATPARQHRHDYRERHLPGGRRHPSAGPARFPRSGRAAPADGLGLDARQRSQLRHIGLLVGIYPAGVAIVLVVVAFNFIGDALRDSLEVRLQQR